MWRRWGRTALLLVASLLVVAGGVVSYVHFIERRAPGELHGLASIQAFDLETFKKTFNADSNEVRVLAMLSPT